MYFYQQRFDETLINVFLSSAIVYYTIDIRQVRVPDLSLLA